MFGRKNELFVGIDEGPRRVRTPLWCLLAGWSSGFVAWLVIVVLFTALQVTGWGWLGLIVLVLGTSLCTFLGLFIYSRCVEFVQRREHIRSRGEVWTGDYRSTDPD